jgi:hypothetical protein
MLGGIVLYPAGEEEVMTDEEYQIMRADLKNTTVKLSHRDDLRLVQNDHTGKVGDHVYDRMTPNVSGTVGHQAVQ